MLAWVLSLLVAAPAAAPIEAAPPPAAHVVSITPPSYAEHQQPSTNIVVEFNSAIDPTTVTASSFRVDGGWGGLHPGSFSFASGASGGTEITYTPIVPFKRGEKVYIVMSSQIKDLSGGNIEPWAEQFTISCVPNEGEFAQGRTHGVGSDPRSLCAGDVNGDGKVDLVVANLGLGSDTISVLIGKGDGDFHPKMDYAVACPRFVKLGDLDGDDDLDAVVTSYCSTTVGVNVLLNDGTGSYGSPETYAVDTPVQLGLADLDGDSRCDIAVNLEGLASTPGIQFLWGNGDGTFQTMLPINLGTSGGFALTLGDVNADGRLDVLATDWGVTVSVILNTGGRTFGTPVNYSVCYLPRSVALADWNGDGAVDLAAVCQNYFGDLTGRSSTISTLQGDGQGNFVRRVDYPVNGVSINLTAGDFNGDGLPDIATANHFSGDRYVNQSLSVWLNNPDAAHASGGTFIPRKDLNVGAYRPSHVVAADFDGDGDLDLASANRGGDSVSILMNAPATVTGRVYLDLDRNCAQNGPEELGVGGPLVCVMNSSGVAQYELTGLDGTFGSVVPAGNYSVNLVHTPKIMETCSGGFGVTYNVNVTEGTPVTDLNFAAAHCCEASVTCSSIISWPCPLNPPVPCSHDNMGHNRLVCPCEPFQYCVTVCNICTSQTSPLLPVTTVRLQLGPDVMFCGFPLPTDIPPIAVCHNNPNFTVSGIDPGLSLDTMGSGNPHPPCDSDCNTNTGQLVQWTLGNALAAGECCTFCVNVQVANVPLGTSLVATPSVEFHCPPGHSQPMTMLGDPCCDEVRCAIDPNDNTVSPAGCGPLGPFPAPTPLTYRTRFQNLGTAPARRVRILVYLDHNLDVETLEILSTSHPVTEFKILPGQELIWTFDGIDLPDATSDELGSRGQVIYRVRPKPSAVEGATILNSAAIYFDLNSPVITNTVTNTIRDVSEPRAVFTARRSNPEAGLEFDFTFTGTPDGATYAWDFGPDATPATSTDRDPAGIRFSTSGPKRVTLTIERYDCTASVTQIVETGLITLDCPTDNIVTEATSPAGAQVLFDVSAASSFCAGPVTVECAPPSGSDFPIGRTVVNCVARDDCGTTSTCSFLVEVGGRFIRGDVDGDGQICGTVTDLVYYANYCFIGGGPAPPCFAAADIDGDGQVCGTVTDLVYYANYCFIGGGPAPPAPFPACDLGNGTTDVTLGCLQPPACQ